MTIHDFDIARSFSAGGGGVAAGANLVADYIAELGDSDSAVVVMRGADGALATSPIAAAAFSATTNDWRRSDRMAC